MVSRFLARLRQVDRQHLLVGKIRIGVVALPLNGGREATLVLPNNEQVDSNERILGVHVAKGGLPEKMLDASPFKPPAAAWFSTPDRHQWGLPQGASMPGCGVDESFRITVHQQAGESVGVDGLHAVRLKLGRWEIVQIERDNVVSPDVDGYGQDVTVRRIREGEALDAVLVSLHAGIGKGPVHFSPGVFEIVPSHVRAI
jgi:hypothetical protein